VLFACSACDKTDGAPPGILASSEARAKGAALFQEHCALCHGTLADGNGVRKAGLSGKPVSFRDKAWRSGAKPNKVFFSIRNGVPGTSMPAWRSLGDDDTWALVAYVLSVSEGGP
jgi:mono/diheme cytochrome c family protein